MGNKCKEYHLTENEIETKLVNLKTWLGDWNKKEFIKKISNLKFTSPAKEDIFNAFKLFPMEETRIVIIGQDPYTDNKTKDCAHGYSFSSQNGKTDSLEHIFDAVEEYVSPKKIKREWNLEKWAETNNVLLLNTALTYNQEQSFTDRKQAWQPFFNQIIQNLLTTENEINPNLVVFLWGEDAKTAFHNAIFYNQKEQKVDITKKIKRNLLVLSTSHPSDNWHSYKKGFYYEAPNHFKICDEFLGKNKKTKKYTWRNFPEK